MPNDIQHVFWPFIGNKVYKCTKVHFLGQPTTGGIQLASPLDPECPESDTISTLSQWTPLGANKHCNWFWHSSKPLYRRLYKLKT